MILLCLAPAAWAHPKPGAHADVRINVDDEGIRFQVLMNILFADQIVNNRRAAREDISDEEAEQLRGALAEYFGAGRAGGLSAVVDRPNVVKIDGFAVAPVIKELRVIRPEPETRPGFVQNPALLLPQIYAVVEYPCKTAPKAVSMVWGTYPRDFIAQNRDAAPVTDVEAVLSSNGDLSLITFKKAEPEIVWHASASKRSTLAAIPAPKPVPARTLPWAAICAAGVWVIWAGTWLKRRGHGEGAPPKHGRLAMRTVGTLLAGGVVVLLLPRAGGKAREVSTEEALEVFLPLQANVYRAFDYARESDIYDALAASVDGGLLDSVYNEVYRGLVMQEEGGALSRVKKVDVLETSVTPNDAGGFGVKARWRVDGVVYHWGHSHSRTNEYLAEFDVGMLPAGWRIMAWKPLEQRRIEGDLQAGSAASVAIEPEPPVPPKGSTWHPDR